MKNFLAILASFVLFIGLVDITKAEEILDRIEPYTENEIVTVDDLKNIPGANSKPDAINADAKLLIQPIAAPIVKNSTRSASAQEFVGKLEGGKKSPGNNVYYLNIGTEKLYISTYRNLDKSLNKTLTMKIEGSKKSFRILSLKDGGVELMGKKANLAQTGPMANLFLVFAFTLGFSLIVRRKTA
ncbi:MAG TPA: hypothetical protein PLQ36_02850 [Candidatus Gracilibacteria bacterium]|nr:hypothetical protein [Candidatus Gracilibacteria bacterium]